ncbi:hypothetical protein Tco_0655943, partial [Tanacetum coccineum]
YPLYYFLRRYRMRGKLFLKIVKGISAYEADPLPDHFNFFRVRPDATGRMSLSVIMKCTTAIRQLAYGTTPDAFDEYLQMSERTARKLAKHSVDLGTYNRTYEPRNAIKGQVLADFLSEASVGTLLEAFFRLPARVQSKDDVERWNLFTDGASNSKGSGAGLFSSALAAQNSGARHQCKGRLEAGRKSDQQKLCGK